MRPGLICLSAIFSASAVLGAQNSVPGPYANSGAQGFAVMGSTNLDLNTAQLPVVREPGAGSCPVSMRAQQGGGGGVLEARRRLGHADPKPDAAAQHIKFVMGNSKKSASIVEVKVTVYGTSGKGRTMPTAFTQNGTSDMSRALDFRVNLATDETASRNLLLNGFTSVQWITLDSVTYADGSVWSSSQGGSCRIAPDPIVLVSAR